MIDFSDFSSEVFQILRAYGRDIVLYDDSGKRVFEPSEARRMYVIGDNILVSIVEDGDNSAVKMFLSPSLNLTQVQGFLETLRRLAIQSNLLFHVKKYNKEIKPKDFATQASVNEQKEIPMNIMEGLYGTSKSSYLKLENARMIVRHSARIKEHVIGDRGRNIHSIFVENAQGERFLFPVNMLSGARAMAQHVSKGGNFADQVGGQIVRMAHDFRNLAQVTTHINQIPGLQESIKENEKVEAHGVKGMKSTPWRKVFKNLEALDAWCEKNDAEVHAYSAVEQNKTHESAIALRVAIIESMRNVKRSFARIYTESTYLGECERVASNTNLMEDSESLTESVAAIASILGEGVSDEAILSVARSVTIESATAPSLDEEVDEIVDEEADLEDGDDEMEEGHQIDMTVEGAGFTDTPNNPQIREFEQWLESFDPSQMFGGKKQPSDLSPEEVQAEIDAIEGQYADPSQMPADVAARWEELANINVTNLKWGTDRIKQDVTEYATDYDSQATTKVANKLQAILDKKFSGYFEWKNQSNGAVVFKQTIQSSPHDASNEYVLSPQNLSKVISPIMDTFRQKGWIFSQPSGGEFTIAVPQGGKVDESSGSQWEVHGIIGLDSKFVKKFATEDARQEWLDKHENSGKFEVTELVDPTHAVAEDAEGTETNTPNYDDRYYDRTDWVEAAESFGFQTQAVGYGSVLATDADGRKVGYYRSTHDSNNGSREMGWFMPPKGEVSEGKSYKKNDDDDAKSKKEKDQERKEAAKSKKEPVAEAQSAAQKAAFAKMIGAKKGKAPAKDETKDDKEEVEEGKSYKKGDDEDAKSKKEKDQERKDAAKNKKQPVEEGKSFKRNDDDDEVDADTKKKEDKQKRDAKKQPVSEDFSNVEQGHSFETNINTEDGQTVSAKVTYSPNEMGVATIHSVVRGDTGEDVLPMMDDSDIEHVEALCYDDIEQQGAPQFAEDTTIPRDARGDFMDDVQTGGRDGEAQDPANIARMKALAGLK
jgi:hypothetical protein